MNNGDTPDRRMGNASNNELAIIIAGTYPFVNLASFVVKNPNTTG